MFVHSHLFFRTVVVWTWGFCSVACVFVLSVLKYLTVTIFILSLFGVGVGLSLMVGEGSVGAKGWWDA